MNRRRRAVMKRTHVVCAWCLAVLSPGNPARQVSCGVCQPCAARLALDW